MIDSPDAYEPPAIEELDVSQAPVETAPGGAVGGSLQ